jgi:hypothetical protein
MFHNLTWGDPYANAELWWRKRKVGLHWSRKDKALEMDMTSMSSDRCMHDSYRIAIDSPENKSQDSKNLERSW